MFTLDKTRVPLEVEGYSSQFMLIYEDDNDWR